MPSVSTGLGDSGLPAAGRLLVATPEIQDGIFRRAVILLLDHDETGSLGVVINHLTDVAVQDLVPGWGDVLFPTVGQGGPVGADSAVAVGLVAGSQTALTEGVRPISAEWAVLDLDSDPETLSPLADAQLFTGYSGWGPGQLDGELRAGAWWVVASSPADLQLGRGGEGIDAWRSVLARQPNELRFAASFPDDPSQN